jgi:hypothetical protein
VINVLLGMKGTGEEDPFHNYFAIFNRLYAEKTKGGPTRATANNRRNAEGAWLAVREESKLEDEGCPDYIVKVDPRVSDEKCPFYYVRAGVKGIIASNVTVQARSLAAAKSTASVYNQEVDFSAMVVRLLPKNLPASKPGFYLLNNASGECHACEDYLYRGCLTDRCKHGKGVTFIANGDIAGAKKEMLKLLANRERTGLPCTRNDILYQGSVCIV